MGTGCDPARVHTVLNMTEIKHRVKRGLFGYYTCSMKDLRQFLQQRDLQSVEYIATECEHPLITRLWLADKVHTFPHFFELPPELRTDIYEHVLCDPDKEGAPVQRCPQSELPAMLRFAALLRASTQLRKEAMPIYYRLTLFIFNPVCPNTSSRLKFYAVIKNYVHYIRHLTFEGPCVLVNRRRHNLSVP